jgi:hypothetical protein
MALLTSTAEIGSVIKSDVIRRNTYWRSYTENGFKVIHKITCNVFGDHEQ